MNLGMDEEFVGFVKKQEAEERKCKSAVFHRMTSKEISVVMVVVAPCTNLEYLN